MEEVGSFYSRGCGKGGRSRREGIPKGNVGRGRCCGGKVVRVQHGVVMGVCEVGVYCRGAMLLKDVLSKSIRVLYLEAANAIVRLRVH